MADLSPAPHSLLSILLILLLLPDLHHCHDHHHLTRSLLSTPRRSSSAVNQIQACTALLSPTDCIQNPNCRWCRSDAVNDMCFHKSEAWRLPSQVFSCQQSPPSSRSLH